MASSYSLGWNTSSIIIRLQLSSMQPYSYNVNIILLLSVLLTPAGISTALFAFSCKSQMSLVSIR